MSSGIIGVVGAGQMGMGIAQVSIANGFDVCLFDISAESLNRAKLKIETNLSKLVEKGKLEEEKKLASLKKLKITPHFEDLAGAALVIEAASERVDIKFDIFKRLDKVCNEKAILASNTSSISITKIAAQTSRPEQVIGMHFMNPVPIMQLVEVIRGLRTSDSTFNYVKNISLSLGKTCVESKDYSGFVVNRILMPMINEACYAVYEGLASIEDVDAAMKLGTNQPMGPLTLADFIGLDTCLAILEVLHEGLGNPKYAPCPLLKQYVDAGLLGKKSGRGFYNYSA